MSEEKITEEKDAYLAAAPDMHRILEEIDRGHLFGLDTPLAIRIEKALRKANG